jgi:hypothetical protein
MLPNHYGLADGQVLREIAFELRLSYPTALKCRRTIAAVTAVPDNWQQDKAVKARATAKTYLRTRSKRSVKKVRAIATQEGKFINFQDLVAALKDPELIAESGAVLAMAHVHHGTTAESVRLRLGYPVKSSANYGSSLRSRTAALRNSSACGSGRFAD